MLTSHEIINETIAAYSSPGTRAVVSNDADACLYFDNRTGNMCAIGRCMLAPQDYDEFMGDVWEIVDNIDKYRDAKDGGINDTFDALLKLQYRGQTLNFWAGLQNLHDFKSNWDNEEGLSYTGKNFVAKLQNLY